MNTKKFLLSVVTVSVLICLSGCGKKQEALEDMQQPMSPEDLSRLTSQTQATAEPNSPAAAVTPTLPQDEAAGLKLETLPPPGPYRPTSLEIQTALKNAGYYTGTIDGKIGPLSKKAIEEFQKANNLTVDGKVGPKTWNLLSKYRKQASAVNLTPTPASKRR